jgi:hypothetical protein
VPPWFSYTLTESKVHSVPLRFIELRKTAFWRKAFCVMFLMMLDAGNSYPCYYVFPVSYCSIATSAWQTQLRPDCLSEDWRNWILFLGRRWPRCVGAGKELWYKSERDKLL